MTSAYYPPAERLIRLNILRRKMERIGEKKGLGHPMTLALSRKLDELVVEVQREEEMPGSNQATSQEP